MYCSNCRKNLPDGAKFCSGCGKPLFSQTQSNNYIDIVQATWKRFLRKTDIIIRHLGVKKSAALLSVAVFAIIILVVWTGGKYDLSGIYQATEFFPFNQFTFDESGHFSAVYYDGSYSETYTGKYQKQGDEYICLFSDGSSSSGNPILNFEASSMSEQCEITAKKVDENTLEIWIVPKIGYWAWGGKSVYFYK